MIRNGKNRYTEPKKNDRFLITFQSILITFDIRQKNTEENI